MRLLLSCCAFLCSVFVPPLAHGHPLHGTGQVNTSAALASYFSDPDATTILLGGNIRLRRSEWREGATILAPGRRLVVRPAGTEPVILDMANIVDAIHVSKGAVLELHNITVTNSACIFGAGISNHTRFVVPFLPLWPSVTFEPGAAIVEVKTLDYYWSALPGEGCDNFRQDVSNSLRPFGLQPSLAFPSEHLQMVLLRGNHLYRQPILDIRTNTSAGYLTMNETDTRSLCIPFPVGGWDSHGADNSNTADDIVTPSRAAAIMKAAKQQGSSSAQGRGSASPVDGRLIALIVSVVLAALLSCVLAGFLIIQRLQLKLRQVQDRRCTDDKEHAPFSGDGPTVPRSPFEDMKISLIDGARAKSDSRLFMSSRGHESQRKLLLTTWETADDSGRELLAAQGHRRWGSADSEASLTIQLSSVPSQRSSLENEAWKETSLRLPLRRVQSLITADVHFCAARSVTLSSARSVDSGAGDVLLASLPPTPGLSPAAAGRAGRSAPAAAAAAAAAALAVAGAPAPILSAPSVQQAAGLTRGELVRLARKASLTSKASLASLASMASSSSLAPQPSASLAGQGSVASRLSLSSVHSSETGLVATRVSLHGPDEEEKHAAAQPSGEQVSEIAQQEQRSSGANISPELQPEQNVLATSTRVSAVAPDTSPPRDAASSLLPGLRTRRVQSPISLLRQYGRQSEVAGLRIGKLIGTGSFGRVYKGSWCESTVAIKAITHDASLSRKVDTLRESLVGISIQHPNVMTTYKVLTTIKANALVDDAPQRRADAARANGYSVAQLGPGSAQTPPEEELLETWLLLEYCDGGPLDRAIANRRFRKNMAAIYLSLMDIAAGMIYLHSLGVVHSDLKGANVLLKSAPVTAQDARGFVCKLADFGLARVLGTNRTHVSTNSHGTVSHQAMEVLHDGRITRSSDVYSFAMIMLEMITGVPVFEGFSASQILYQVFNGARPHVPDGLPPGYRQLIEDCWHSDHTARPTFVTVQERLHSLYRETCLATNVPTPP
ncbi:g4464 [Coccomyxa elongata]